jgi:hypothetical protein
MEWNDMVSFRMTPLTHFATEHDINRGIECGRMACTSTPSGELFELGPKLLVIHWNIHLIRECS